MKSIKIGFRGKMIEVQNQSKRDTTFTTNWNGYQIRLRKNKDAFRIKVISPLSISGEILSDDCKTINDGMHKAFRAIDSDIAEMEYMKKDRWLLIASTNGSFADSVKEAETILSTIEY